MAWGREASLLAWKFPSIGKLQKCTFRNGNQQSLAEMRILLCDSVSITCTCMSLQCMLLRSHCLEQIFENSSSLQMSLALMLPLSSPSLLASLCPLCYSQTYYFLFSHYYWCLQQLHLQNTCTIFYCGVLPFLLGDRRE